jgi:AcrR family transcriptional regulator
VCGIQNISSGELIMAQVLKEDIRQRIYAAAVEEFYSKDYRNATIRAIAKRAEVPLGLVYTYYKNKQALLSAIVEPIFAMIKETMEKAENSNFHSAFENFEKIEFGMFLDLFEKRKELIILIDKSSGTEYGNAKETIINLTETHIKKSHQNKDIPVFNDFLVHIWANSLIEGMFEIIRHCTDRKSAEKMMELVARQYYYGIEGLND